MTVVLCIDDDHAGLMLRKWLLESRGYQVITAPSGRAGVALARRFALDAVVLDFQMPHMDGEQVAKLLRRDCPKLPIILLSGSGEVPGSVLSMVSEYLEKDAPDLLEALDRALSRITRRHFRRAA